MPKIIAQKSDWIKLGFKLFSRKGVSGIVVEQMARTLKCNKSSFYWHFKSKDQFILEIVDLWSYNDTQQVIDLANEVDDVNNRYDRFIRLVFQKDPFLDFVFYLKRYAIKRPEIQSVMDRIDEQRLTFVRSLLIDLGCSSDESKMKASIFYKYLIGFHELNRYQNLETGYLNEVMADLELILQLKMIN